MAMEYFGRIVEIIGSQVSHMSSGEIIIFDIGIVLILSGIFALIARMFRQPLIPAYVLSGLVIGPVVLGYVRNLDLIYALSEIGIAFLLFIAGIEISFKKIKEANLKRIILVGIFQVLIIFALTYFSKGFLGLNNLQAAYMGIILAFGSTMVDIKLLAERGELVTLHGRIVLGILLLQDLVAIIAIILFTSGGFAVAPIALAFVKLIGMVVFALLLQKFVLNRIFSYAARSSELLLLTSVATLFLFIIFAFIAELSIAIGAFIAGVVLANSPFKTELESKISPLRDFFAILFFVALGMQILFSGIWQWISLLIFLIIGGIVIKPLLTFLLLRINSYHEKTSFLASISLAQLSEFSLIIGMLGLSLGVFDTSLLSTVILATIVTMSLTPYFIKYKNHFYKALIKPLSLLRFLPISKNLEYRTKTKKEVLLIGAHRMGSLILKELLKEKDKLVVMDYNPEIVKSLVAKKISCIYGDITSPEIIKNINTSNLKTVISTMPEFEDNHYLIRKIKTNKKATKVIVTASRISEAKKLYRAGADFVITPKIVAGEEINRVLSKKGSLSKERRKHMNLMDRVHKILY